MISLHGRTGETAIGIPWCISHTAIVYFAHRHPPPLLRAGQTVSPESRRGKPEEGTDVAGLEFIPAVAACDGLASLWLVVLHRVRRLAVVRPHRHAGRRVHLPMKDKAKELDTTKLNGC